MLVPDGLRLTALGIEW